MRFLVEAVLILVMLLILGVDIKIIISIILGAAGILILLMEIFFIICTAILVTSKRKNAEFSRIDKGIRGLYECAYYAVDGKEYPNIFPCESVMRSRLYCKDKTVKVMLCRKIGVVFDSTSMCTTILGVSFGTFICTAALIMFIAVK